MISVLLAFFMALSTGAAYPSQSASDGHGGNHKHAIIWGPCDPSVVKDTSLSCGFFEVPLDYHDPTLGNARLAVVKANATGERQGSVMFNPGGPGGSGLEALSENKDILLAVTGGAYDIISWDPRGVGLTTPGPVVCFESLDEYTSFYAGTIELSGIEETGNFTDPADIDALFSQADIMQKKYAEVAEKCMGSPSGKYLRYMGTAAAVRDMVSIVDAIEGPDAPVNYLGTSYGTIIGSWFLNMFPERVGRVIIDGVQDPIFFATQEVSTHWSHQLTSADDAYKGLVTGCALAGPTGCAAASEGDTPLDVDARVQALLKAAHDAKVANSSTPLTSGIIRPLLYTEMYTPRCWSAWMNEVYPALVEAVKDESQNSSAPLARRSLPIMRRDPSPSDPAPCFPDSPAPSAPPSYTYITVFCGDSVDVHGTTVKDVFEAVVDGSQHVSHLFGSLWPTLASQCSFWPIRSVERYQGPFNKKLANKILVASSTYDPITPLAGAQVLAGLLGDDAALVRLNGFGHTTFNDPSSCMTAVFAAYMVNGTMPANNVTVCEVDADFEIFDGVTTGDILANLPSADVRDSEL